MTYVIALPEDLAWGQAGPSGLNDHVGTPMWHGDPDVGGDRTQGTCTLVCDSKRWPCALQPDILRSVRWVRRPPRPLGSPPALPAVGGSFFQSISTYGVSMATKLPATSRDAPVGQASQGPSRRWSPGSPDPLASRCDFRTRQCGCWAVHPGENAQGQE